MPALNLSSLFRREPTAPSLRERAAALRASVTSRGATAGVLPAPGSAEAKAAFAEACREHSVRTNPPGGWPDLMRNGERIWNRGDLGEAMDTGEITPVEYARLYPLANERELLIETVAHELNIGSLFALAHAADFPLKTEEPDENEEGDDAELLSLTRDWEAAATAYDQAIRDQEVISDGAAAIEAPPSRELPHPEWPRLVAGWRERTGVEAAEVASAEALDVLCRIEDRISALPATTLAGLKLKARVAKRNEVAWPDGLDEGLVRDILAIGEPAVEADAELLRLGRRFDVVSARENAANEACNAAQREADRHMPARPASLIYRASDANLMVHQNRMMAEALAGREVRSSDIEWLRLKMPMHHEVLRPIRDGERAHIDHPGRRYDLVPYPEAQARAEEIVSAWEAWHAERLRTQGEHFPEALDDAANDASELATSLAERIAALPARTAAGFKVKLRALAHYRKAIAAELPDLPDPDQLLSHSLWRDVQGSAAPAPTEKTENLTDAILDAWAAWGSTLDFSDDDLEAVTDWELKSDRRSDLIHAAANLPATRENIIPKALASAWMEWVVTEHPGQPREAYALDGQLTFDIHAAIMGQPSNIPQVARRQRVSILDQVDLVSATLEDLVALSDTADLVADVAHAVCWQGRCHDRRWDERFNPGDQYNVAGRLMQWLGDELVEVVSATAREATRRLPVSEDDRRARMMILARGVIENDDPQQTAALASELADHAAAAQAQA